jgi:mycofactocin system glycosyltransferase
VIERGGTFALVCTYPLQNVILNPSAFRVLSALDGVTPLNALMEPIEPYLVDWLESLVTQGCLSARYHASVRGAPATVEVIIPVFENAAGLKRCFEALARLDYPRRCLGITVVDDGSAKPAEPELRSLVNELAEQLPPVRWLRLGVNRGPADARNAALEAQGGTPSDLMAFLDSDCAPSACWLLDLTAALEDPTLAAVGGQVAGLNRKGWLARYEDQCASLNLGPAGGPAGAPQDRIPYLPTCNLLVRRSAIAAVGGFAPGLRLGEDVDLIWRMQARGLRAFYLPAGRVEHAYRDRLRAFLERKAAYAGSEVRLRLRHPRRFAQVSRIQPGGRGRGGNPSSSRPNLAPDAAAGLVACGILAGSAAVGVGAALLLLLGETIGHVVTQARAILQTGGNAVAPGALVRRLSAHLLVRSRSMARHGAIAALPLLSVCVVAPALLVEGLAIWAMAALGEYLARRPRLSLPVFLYGYTLDVLAYISGWWKVRIQCCAEWLRAQAMTVRVRLS